MPSVKEIYEKITDVTIDADTINLNTDTVESLLSTVQADVALVKADIANGVLSDVRDGTGNAITSSARGSQRALSVQIVDGSGNQVTTFGSSSVSVSNFPATQPVSGTFWPATQPVSGSVSVTDNGGSLTVDGSITATQSTASSLKAQAQLLNAAGTVVEYATTGSAGTPATDVVSVQGVAGGTAIPVSLASVPSHPVTGTFWPATQPVTDNGGSLTVDGTVTSRLADGAGNNLTSVARGSERALSVQIVDASGAQVTTFGGGGGGTVTATQTTPSALKAQAQILDATGSQMSFANAGIAGTPSVDVLTVQGSTSGTPIPVRLSQPLTGTNANTYSFNYTYSTTLAVADANRKALTIFNEGSGYLYIKTQAYGGDTVSSSNYQRRMAAGEYWEVPTAQITLLHLGIIAGSGVARITTVT
jgi:hypothetical protein